MQTFARSVRPSQSLVERCRTRNRSHNTLHNISPHACAAELTRPLLCEGAESRTNTQSSSDALFNASETQHHLTQQLATLHSKWHELAQECHPSGVWLDAGVTPKRERDQGPITLTLRRRRQRLCEGRTGRVIIVVTIASRGREASIVHVQRTDGSGETRKNAQCYPTARRVEGG